MSSNHLRQDTEVDSRQAVSQKIVEAEKTLGLKIKPTKCDFFPWGHN